MGLVNNSLTKEEHEILSCNKENWHKDKSKHDKFIKALKKYISLYGSDSTVYFESISFPDITFSEKLFVNNGLHIQKCVFYGKVLFIDLVCKKEVNINHCEFLGEVVYENIIFKNEVQMFWNTYHKEVIFKDLIFKNKLDIDDVFNDNVTFQALTFNKEVDFSSLVLKEKCQMLNISGAEHLKWNELLCIYDSPDVFWDEREKYIDSIFEKQDSIDKETLILVKELKAEFPEVVKKISRYLEETSSGWSCYSWIEQFGNSTKELFQRRNYREAEKHLFFMEKVFLKGSERIQNIIEVAYIENILWKVSSEIRNEALKYVPYTLNIGYL